MLPNYLKIEKESVLFNTDGEFVFYVPEKYFESKFAVYEGEYISILGILRYKVFDAKGKAITNGFRDFKFSSFFHTRPYDIERVRDIEIDGRVGDYRLLKYGKGDMIVVSTKVPQITENIDSFFNLFNSGKQPTNIPYNEIQDYYIECGRLNGMKYGVTTQVIGILISELYRDPKDLSRPYRLSKDFDNKNYQPINIKDVPKYTSPFTAFTSENFDEAMVAALTNKKETYSPLERLVTD